MILRKAEGRDQPETVATDAGGHFALKDIEPGRYQLWVERNGYVRQEYGQRNPDRSGTYSATTLLPEKISRPSASVTLLRFLPAWSVTVIVLPM